MTHADELKNSGLKATLPRIKVLEVFQKTKERHMSADILSRNHFETGKAVFELNEGKHHDHLVCLDCGRVEEFFDAEIEKRQRGVAHARGFELQDHALALYAVCTKKNCEFKVKIGASGR
jgi:Fur family ferric uptake transcriptional regulator